MKTPFYECHKSLNGKMVDFNGWVMPIQYSGIINEHLTVRTRVGLFDVSHMGRFEVKGSNSFELLQNLMTNDLSNLQDYQALYSPMCYDSAGIVDDLIIYKINQESFLLVVNASNRQKDFEWILQHSKQKSRSVNIDDVTESMALLALQGPMAHKVLQEIVDINFEQLKPFNIIKAKLFGVECIISRTGYTGEDGFELFFDSSEVQVWDKLLQVDSNKFGITPAGLGARDTLRLEAGFMLYGNDIDENTTPLEVPLAWTVKIDKKQDFMGKKKMQMQMNSVTRKLVGFEMQGKRIARHGNQVFIKGSKVGFVTSGGFSPTLKKSIGFCFVPLEMPFDQLVDISIARGSGVGREGGAGAGREGQGGREEGEGEGEGEGETGAAETETIQTAEDERLYSAKIMSTRFYKRNKDL